MLWWFPSQLHPIWGPGQGQEGLLGNLGCGPGSAVKTPRLLSWHRQLAGPASPFPVAFILSCVSLRPAEQQPGLIVRRGQRARSRHSWSHLPSSGVAGVQGEEGKDTRPPSGQRGLRPSPFWGLLETLRGRERKRRRDSQAPDLGGAVRQGWRGRPPAPPPSGLPLHTEVPCSKRRQDKL